MALEWLTRMGIPSVDVDSLQLELEISEAGIDDRASDPPRPDIRDSTCGNPTSDGNCASYADCRSAHGEPCYQDCSPGRERSRANREERLKSIADYFGIVSKPRVLISEQGSFICTITYCLAPSPLVIHRSL